MARNPYKETADQSPDAAARRLLEVYAIGARAAARHQAEGVRNTLALLRSTLDPRQSPEITLSLTALYNDIEGAIDKEQYETACSLFEKLRALWQARINIKS